MSDDNTMSYAQALARLIADPQTTYRLRQRIKDDPLLNPSSGSPASPLAERELLARLDDLCRQDALWPNEGLPSLSVHTLDEAKRGAAGFQPPGQPAGQPS